MEKRIISLKDLTNILEEVTEEWSGFLNIEPDEVERNALLYALSGRGAFRFFKVEVSRFRLWEQYDNFYRSSLYEIVKEGLL